MPLPDTIRWTLILWLTVLGGCIGSFLNVVVYRLPRGQSLMHPGSRCPRCGHAIRWRHNLPVLGWLMLRGRCFDCSESIATRYPIVEAIVAFWFGALAWYGPLSAQAYHSLDVAWIWEIFLYHLVLCCVLLCLILIDWDSQSDGLVRYPTKLWGIALSVGVSAPFFDPRIHPIAVGTAPAGWQGVLGAVFGVLIGFACCSFWTRNDRSAHNASRGTGQIILIGAFLGWVAMIAVGAASVVVALAARTRARTDGTRALPARSASVVMLIGVAICVLAWKSIRPE